MAAYDYINQSIMATCLIQPKDIDSFYNPITQGHTGFAWDGVLYSAGVQQYTPTSPPNLIYASWYTEGVNAFRGELQTFPQTGLVLLSKAALTILDGSTSALNLWMQFLVENQYALADNWNDALNGWLPSNVIYADGVISVIYTPDPGNKTGSLSSPPIPGSYNINSSMVVHLDFTQDSVYVDVALIP
jgi:hypothetical protein